jgi:hypothetical protein
MTKRIVVSTASTSSPTPTTEPSPNPQVGLAQPDGGPSYYGRFTNPLSTSPDYFPIGVWGAYSQTAANRNLDADVGINLYVWAADPGFWDDIAADPRFDLFGGSPDRNHANANHVNGWVLADEIDMQQGPGACPGQVNSIKASLPADGTARYNNYGKGIFPGWETDEQFACFVNSQDVTSDDIYWFTDPHACGSLAEGPSFFGLNRALTLAECRRASNYGYVVDRMRTLDARDGERRPIWNFVEVSHPWHEPSHITGSQIRAAVWHSLIAGARGIIYFQHTFELGSTCSNPHHTLRSDCHGNRQAVKAVNAQVKAVAPVLNAPFVTSGHSATGDVKHMVKFSGGKFYVFAGAHNGGGQATFSIPCVGDATAVVAGENRSIPVNGGQWTDLFADPNAIHIYRIDGGSTCGLPTDTGQPPYGDGGSARSGKPPSTGELPGGRTARVGRLPRRVSLRSGRLLVPVACVAVCTVRSRLTTRGASRRVRLAASRRRFDTGAHKLVLRLSKRGRRYVARARAPLAVRLNTIIVEPGGGAARRTQHLIARRR